MSAIELEPEEAKRLGVVLDVYEDDELMPKCEDLARRIAKNSTMAKTYIKTTLNRNAIADYQEAERFMPAIFSTDIMLSSFAKFLKGDTKNVK